MATLLREYCQKLLERLCWFSLLKCYLELVASQEITCEWCVVVWIIPIPGDASIVIVLEDPFEALDVGLSDVPAELLDLAFSDDMEFFSIVPLFPTFLGKFNLVLVCFD